MAIPDSIPKSALPSSPSTEEVVESSTKVIITSQTARKLGEGFSRLNHPFTNIQIVTSQCVVESDFPLSNDSKVEKVEKVKDKWALVQELPDFKLVFKVPPTSNERLILSKETLDDRSHFPIRVDLVHPDTGVVAYDNIEWTEATTHFSENWVWMVNIKCVADFFTPSEEFKHYYAIRSYELWPPPLSSEEQEWYKVLGQELPPNPRMVSFRGMSRPYGIFQPVLFNGSEFQYLDEIRMNNSIMIPLLVSDSDGYPLTSPRIPRFG